MKHLRHALSVSALFVLSCGDGETGAGEGKVRVLLQAEESITKGLTQGEGDESAEDYAVTFTKYLATFGNVRLEHRDGDVATLDEVFVADMMGVGGAGIELGVFPALAAGQWEKFGFETPIAKEGAKALDGVSQADLAVMVEQGLTYWIEGVVERAEESGGPVKFVIQTDVPTVFSNCEADGEPGVSVVGDGTATSTISLHGDHIFFNRFPTGAESEVKRLSGYLTLGDSDDDGVVTTEELAALDATVAFAGYDLGGAKHPISTALDFVRIQLATQGHYAGEGECAWDFRGTTGG
jgi:hypothetical protein